VPPDYDSLLAKVISWGQTRDQAIARMDRALAELIITGIPTSTAFLRMLVTDEKFRRGDVHTGFVAEFMNRNEALVSTLQDKTPNHL
jgi:acetyl-CoA carboxylase biotin carboxylase subunit